MINEGQTETEKERPTNLGDFLFQPFMTTMDQVALKESFFFRRGKETNFEGGG